MKLLRATRKAPSRETEDMIVFTVSGIRFAIAASAVDEIRNLEGLVPLSALHRASKARYTLAREEKARENNYQAGRSQGSPSDHARRDHRYFVVDASSHFHMPSSEVTRVLLLRDCATAVLVDGIDRMMQVSRVVALPLAFSGEERAWYRGLAVVDGEVIPVVNPNSFLSKVEVATLQAAFKSGTASSQRAKGAATA